MEQPKRNKIASNAIHASIERGLRGAIAAFVLLLILAMYPFTNDPTGDIKRLITGWAALALAVAWMTAVAVYGLPVRRPRIFAPLLLCLLGLYLILALLSPFRWFGLIEVSSFFSLFVLYAMASQVYHGIFHVRRLFIVVCVAMVLASLYGFVQGLEADPFPWADRESEVYTNLPATFGNPNFAAHALVFAIFMVLYLLITSPGWRSGAHVLQTEGLAGVWSIARGVGLLSLGLMVFLVGLAGVIRNRGLGSQALVMVGLALLGERFFRLGRTEFWQRLKPVMPLAALAIFLIHFHLTGQRAGIIALAAGVFLVLAARYVGSRFKRPLRGAVITLVLVAVTGLVGVQGAMTLSKWKTGTPIPLDPSLIIRYQSYVSAANMLFDNPLFGHGPGVYGISYPQYWTPFEQEWFAQELSMNAHVHNDLMEVAIDAGLPGAGLYLTVLVLGMIYGLLLAFRAPASKARYLGYVFAAIFGAFLVDGLFGFNLRVPVSAALLFLMMGALEGVWASREGVPAESPGARRPLKLALAASLAAMILCVILDSAVFASEYYMHKGMGGQFRGDVKEARTAFERGARWAPWNWDFEGRLGQVSMEERKPQESVRHFQKSLEQNPYYILTNLRLAIAKMALAQEQARAEPEGYANALKTLDEAAAHINDLLEICPMYSKAHELLGRSSATCAVYAVKAALPDALPRAREYWQRAEEHLLEALEHEVKEQGELYRLLAKVRMALGDNPGAEEALVRALEHDPSDPATWPIFLEFANKLDRHELLRNMVYAQIRRIEDTGAPDQDALALAYLYLADVLEHGYNDLDGTDQAFLKAAEYGAAKPEIWTNFARYSRDKNRPEVLKNAIADACARWAGQDETPLGYLVAANAVLQEGSQALPEASKALMSYVRAYHQRNALSTAQTFGWAAHILLDTLRAAPPGQEGLCAVYLNLGIAFSGMGELRQADALFAKAEPCLEGAEETFLAVYWSDTIVRLGRSREAIARLHAARMKYPENLEIHLALARTLARADETKRARLEYETLLQNTTLAPQGRELIQREMQTLPNTR